MQRTATVERKTKETDIRLSLQLNGKGASEIDTGIPFMDHMLTLFAAHGFMDLQLSARGDTEVDHHHTIEDIGICLGEALRQALGTKEGIRRYGHAVVPMDEALSRVVIDISNRAFLAYRVALKESKTGTFDIHLIKEFFRAVAHQAGLTLHVDLLSGEEPHHISESIFKAFGRALDQAVCKDDRLGERVLSTKGIL